MMKSFVFVALVMASPVVAQTSSRQAAFDASDSAGRTGTSPEKIICRSQLETGSLVKRTRTCLTSSQWSARIRGENDGARRIVQDNAGIGLSAGQ